MDLLGSIRRGRVHWREIRILKKTGKTRILHAPSPWLKKIHRLLNKNLFSDVPIADNVYGFSGGSVLDAIKPHLKTKSRMMVDIKNAFPSIMYRQVVNFLRFGDRKQQYEINIKEIDGREKLVREPVWGYFSSSVSRVICDLCLFDGRLPQGAPTSPRLFDLVFSMLDDRLNMIAEKTKSTYTRYADNIFFSCQEESFPKRLMWEVLDCITWIEGFSKQLEWHKLKLRRASKEAVRMLGLNIIDGRIYNTRHFKLQLRKHVHHLEWLKKNDYYYDKEYEKLIGMMGFAQKNTLPAKLLKRIEHIKEYY